MRRLYRERRYVCGDYLEVDIFPVFRKQMSRGVRTKPTSETQARLNEHNAEQKLIRILNANFTSDDIEIHLTYRDDVLPETPEEVKRDVQNFIRRVKRLRNRMGLGEMKYVVVPGGGYEGTRFHAHVTMSGGVDRSELEGLWGYGYGNSKRLQFNENGIEGLARYAARQFTAHKGELPFGKRWSGSRNLIIPPPQDRDGRLSQKKVKELSTFDVERCEPFEALYKGYRFASVRPFYNEVNGGYYLCIKMYREGVYFAKKKRRSAGRRGKQKKSIEKAAEAAALFCVSCVGKVE